MGLNSIERLNNIVAGNIKPAASNKEIGLPVHCPAEKAVEPDPTWFDSQADVDQYKYDLLKADEEIPLKELADRFPAYVKSSAYLGNLEKDIEFVIPFLVNYEPLSPILSNFKITDRIAVFPSSEQYPKYKRCSAANFISKYLELIIKANTDGSEKDKTLSLLGKNYFSYLDSARILKQEKAAFALVWPYLNENIFKVPDVLPGGFKNRNISYDFICEV